MIPQFVRRSGMSGVCACCGEFFADDMGGGMIVLPPASGKRGRNVVNATRLKICSDECADVYVTQHLLETPGPAGRTG